MASIKKNTGSRKAGSPASSSSAECTGEAMEVYMDAFRERMAGQNCSPRRLTIDPSWPLSRLKVAAIVTHMGFDLGISFLIMIQLFLVIHETNHRAGQGEESVPVSLVVVAKMIFIAYLVEAGLRIFAFRMDVTKDTWTVFDFILLAGDMLCELLALGTRWVPSITCLRVVKAVPICCSLKAVRLLPVLRELYVMLHGMLSTVRAMCWAAMLLSFVLTVWAVVAVKVLHPINKEVVIEGTYDNCHHCARAFESVQAAAITFVQHIVAGDNWGQVSIPIMEKKPWTAVVFLSVLISVDIGLLNLVLAVIVDRAAQARQEDECFVQEQRELQFEAAKNSLRSLFVAVGKENNGHLTKEELLRCFDTQPEFEQALRLIDVSREDVATLFRVLDTDGQGKMACDDFVEQLHRMKSKDLDMVVVFLKDCIQDVRGQVDEQLKITKEVLVEHSIAQEARTKHIVDLITGALLGTNEVLQLPEVKAGAFEAGSGGRASRSFPKLPQGRLADALAEDLNQLRRQLSADLATATCSVVDEAISQLLGPGSSRSPVLLARPWYLGQGVDTRSMSRSTSRSISRSMREAAGGSVEKEEYPSAAAAFITRFGSPSKEQSSPGASGLLELPPPPASAGLDAEASRQRSPPPSPMAVGIYPKVVEPRSNSRISCNTCCSVDRDERPQMITSSKW